MANPQPDRPRSSRTRQHLSPSAVEKPLPNNFEAERSILGAILVAALKGDSSAIVRAGEKVEPDDFFSKDHRKIYLAILELHNDGVPVDLVMLTDYLEQKKELETIGGAAYLAQLMDGMPSITNIEHYATIVRKKAVQRQLIYAGARMQEQALDGEDDLQTLLHAAEQSVCRVLEFDKREPVPHLNGNGNGHVDFQDYSLGEFMAAKFPPKEHLIQYLTPRNGRAMLIALPHRLKSFATTGLSLASSVAGLALGHLVVEKPVRTYLAQLEDWPGELQARVQQFLLKQQFSGCDPANIRILPRCALDLTNDAHFAWMIARLKEFKPDHVILDVLRKFFSGDVNSPKETAAFLKRLDALQDIVGCALTLVHHENRKKEELMLAAAGSYNWAGWAEVMIHFSRKTEAKTDTGGSITAVEIEVDTKAGPPVETQRLVLDMSLQHPLRLEALEDGTGFRDAMTQLAGEWNVDALASVLDVHRKSAWKRIEAWMKSGKIEKIKQGKRGRGGGLAVFRSLDPLDSL